MAGRNPIIARYSRLINTRREIYGYTRGCPLSGGCAPSDSLPADLFVHKKEPSDSVQALHCTKQERGGSQ
jgi:hypothetical protein